MTNLKNNIKKRAKTFLKGNNQNSLHWERAANNFSIKQRVWIIIITSILAIIFLTAMIVVLKLF